MEDITSKEANTKLKEDMKILIYELLKNNNETYEDLRKKLKFSGRAIKYLKKGKLSNLVLLYKIAYIYNKRVRVSIE